MCITSGAPDFFSQLLFLLLLLLLFYHYFSLLNTVDRIVCVCIVASFGYVHLMPLLFCHSSGYFWVSSMAHCHSIHMFGDERNRIRRIDENACVALHSIQAVWISRPENRKCGCIYSYNRRHSMTNNNNFFIYAINRFLNWAESLYAIDLV